MQNYILCASWDISGIRGSSHRAPIPFSLYYHSLYIRVPLKMTQNLHLIQQKIMSILTAAINTSIVRDALSASQLTGAVQVCCCCYYPTWLKAWISLSCNCLLGEHNERKLADGPVTKELSSLGSLWLNLLRDGSLLWNSLPY